MLLHSDVAVIVLAFFFSVFFFYFNFIVVDANSSSAHLSRHHVLVWCCCYHHYEALRSTISSIYCWTRFCYFRFLRHFPPLSRFHFWYHFSSLSSSLANGNTKFHIIVVDFHSTKSFKRNQKLLCKVIVSIAIRFYDYFFHFRSECGEFSLFAFLFAVYFIFCKFFYRWFRHFIFIQAIF